VANGSCLAVLIKMLLDQLGVEAAKDIF
jgi:hypothetical protein